MAMRWFEVGAALALALGVAVSTPACSTGGSGGGGHKKKNRTQTPVTNPQQPVPGELKPFQSEPEIEKYIEDAAIREMELMVDGWAYQYPPGGGGGPVIMRTAGPAVMAASAPGAGGAGGGSSAPAFSTTNNQVGGVDEPDFVKNDGEFIYKLVNQSLVIVDAWPADQIQEVGRATVEGWPSHIFLRGDRVIVISMAPPPVGMERPDVTPPYPVYMSRMACIAPCDPNFGGCGGSYVPPVVKLTVYDVSQRSAPAVIRETYFEGGYVDARLAGGKLHVVTTAKPPGPVLKYWQDWSIQPTQADLDAIKAENRVTIEAATLAEWLPREFDRATAQTPSLALGATSTFKPEVAEGRNILTLTTMDLDVTVSPANVGIVAETGEIYATASSLYVASHLWDYWWSYGVGTEPPDASMIHKFALGSDAGPQYVGTGQVDGRVLNQFAMDEWNGFVRVATTTEATATNGNPRLNHLFIMGQIETGVKKLTTVGSIRDLAPNERIYATRFVGERGFIVTFRQVDPLFALDLKDPLNPRVMGELKCDGFSTYLHPVGTDHLLAIGNAADPVSGMVTGLELTVFNVSDMANPALDWRTTLAGAYSQSLYEHKAFNYFEPQTTLAIPLSDWQSGFSGLEVYDVTVVTGFNLRGRVDHGDLAAQLGWGWQPEVSRSIIIGNAIYSVSDVGIKANEVQNPTTELGAVVIQ